MRPAFHAWAEFIAMSLRMPEKCVHNRLDWIGREIKSWEMVQRPSKVIIAIKSWRLDKYSSSDHSRWSKTHTVSKWSPERKRYIGFLKRHPNPSPREAEGINKGRVVRTEEYNEFNMKKPSWQRKPLSTFWKIHREYLTEMKPALVYAQNQKSPGPKSL